MPVRLAVPLHAVEDAFAGAFREIRSEMDPAKRYECRTFIENGELVYEWREISVTPLKPGPTYTASKW